MSMINRYRWLFAACLMTSITCYAQEESNQPFSLDDLIDHAEITDEPPASRTLPWYIATVEKPASRIVFALCNAWDWIKNKGRNAIHRVWPPQEKISKNSMPDKPITPQETQTPTKQTDNSYGES